MLLLILRDQSFVIKQKGPGASGAYVVIERKKKGSVFYMNESSTEGIDLSTQIIVEKVCHLLKFILYEVVGPDFRPLWHVFVSIR